MCFLITHDFIATMMGTDRSTVSLAASVLPKKGIIDYVRGAVKIVNRRKLERSACECYEVIQHFEDDLGLRWHFLSVLVTPQTTTLSIVNVQPLCTHAGFDVFSTSGDSRRTSLGAIKRAVLVVAVPPKSNATPSFS